MKHGGWSLQKRVLFVALASLLVFLFLITFGIDRAFERNLKVSIEKQMQTRIYALMAALDLGVEQVLLASPDPALASPASGVCAMVGNPAVIWRSASCIGENYPELNAQVNSMTAFRLLSKNDQTYYSLQQTVIWELANGESLPLVFAVFESSQPYDEQHQAFRQTLTSGAIIAGVILWVLQWLSLFLLLRPIREIESEVQAVEQGEQQFIMGMYPRELATLSHALNALLQTGSQQLQRYRNSLADLAHSLKTPLSVMRASLDDRAQDGLNQRLEQELKRMDSMVAWHLKRASTAGQQRMAGITHLADLMKPLVQAMNKLFANRGITVDLIMQGKETFRADKGDLQEVCGNIMENACKWANSRVLVTVEHTDQGLSIEIEDDGPGFESQKEQLLQRGFRADELSEGQGIGLAIVAEVVRAYGGKIELGQSQFKGAKVSILIPEIS